LIRLILVLVDSSPISEQALLEAINIGKIYHSKIACVHPIPRHDELLLKVGHEIIKRAEEIVSSTGLIWRWSGVWGSRASRGTCLRASPNTSSRTPRATCSW